MQEPLEGISFNSLYYFLHCRIFFFFLCGDDVSARCILCPASINEMPAPDAVFVFIKISYKIFYNRFRVIGV